MPNLRKQRKNSAAPRETWIEGKMVVTVNEDTISDADITSVEAVISGRHFLRAVGGDNQTKWITSRRRF